MGWREYIHEHADDEYEDEDLVDGMDPMDAAKERQIREEEDAREMALESAFSARCERSGDE